MKMALKRGQTHQLGTNAGAAIHALIQNKGPGNLDMDIAGGVRTLQPEELVVVATNRHIAVKAVSATTIEVEV